MLVNSSSSNRKGVYDDKSYTVKMRKNKKNNSIGGITNSNNNYHNQNNSLSFNTSSFLSPGNGNPSLSGAGSGVGGGLGSNLSFFKSGKSQSSLQQ